MNDVDVVEERVRRAMRAFADRPVGPSTIVAPWVASLPTAPGSRRRVLLGLAAAAVVVTVAAVLLAYGPRSANPALGTRPSTLATERRTLSTFKVTYVPASPLSTPLLRQTGAILGRRLEALGARAVTVSVTGQALSVSGQAPGSDIARDVLTVGETLQVTVRPVLCEAPDPVPSPAGSEAPSSSAPLPPCAAAYQSDKQPDPAFGHYLSTPLSKVDSDPTATVLVPWAGNDDVRLVLGPSRLDGTAITGTQVERKAGQWLVAVHLTPAGSAAWDTLAQSEFHRRVAFVVDGAAEPDPVIEPTRSSFASSDGVIQLPVSTEAQARGLANLLSFRSLPVALVRTSEVVIGPGLKHQRR